MGWCGLTADAACCSSLSITSKVVASMGDKLLQLDVRLQQGTSLTSTTSRDSLVQNPTVQHAKPLAQGTSAASCRRGRQVHAACMCVSTISLSPVLASYPPA
jgi:hypothetical protein